MKKLILQTLSFVSVVVLGTLIFVACSKTSQEVAPLSNSATQIQELTSLGASYEFEMNIAIGTYLFNNCGYNYPCGPCPGICFRRKPRRDKLESMETVSSVFVDDSHLQIFFNKADGYDNGSGNVGLEEDVEFEVDLAKEQGFSSVKMLRGSYPITYTKDYSNGYTIINVETTR